MATRRPKVPSAQYSAGAKKPAAGQDATPEPGPDAPGASPDTHRQGTGSHGSARTPRKTVSDPRRSGSHASERHVADRNGAGHNGAERTRGEGSGPRSKASDGGAHEAESGYTPVPARSFNGRLLVLGLVMAAVTVALAPNIHTYVGQRQEISALQQDIAAQTAQQTAQQAELARWDDPAYVKQQARDRVSMLMPGETGYWVYGASAAETTAAEAGSTAAAGESADAATTTTTEPWVDSLWKAVEKSATLKPADTPKPAAKHAVKPTSKPSAK